MNANDQKKTTWNAVCWVFAVVFYCLTLAIAFDQVNSRDREIVRLKKWQSETRKGLKEMGKTIDGLQGDTAAMQENNRRTLEMLEGMRDAGIQNVKDLEVLKNAIPVVLPSQAIGGK